MFVTVGSPQIDANEFASATQIFNDAETVAEIVSDEECVAVRTDRNPTRINWRAIAVVSR